MRALSLLLVALAAWPVAALAQDTNRGRLLYDTHCGACHYERMHERQRMKIRDLSDLRLAVARWSTQTKRTFAPDEIDDVVAYLDKMHYHLTEKTP
jgi:mono/diheme cytochrome c family protein